MLKRKKKKELFLAECKFIKERIESYIKKERKKEEEEFGFFLSNNCELMA